MLTDTFEHMWVIFNAAHYHIYLFTRHWLYSSRKIPLDKITLDKIALDKIPPDKIPQDEIPLNKIRPPPRIKIPLDKIPWTKSPGTKSPGTKSSHFWAILSRWLCTGGFVTGDLSQGICHRGFVTGDLSRGILLWRIVTWGNFVLWICCHGGSKLFMFLQGGLWPGGLWGIRPGNFVMGGFRQGDN